MAKQRQLGFDILNKKSVKHFGGAYLKNSNAKEKRPITTKRAMHLVVRSTLAKGPLSFLRYNKKVTEIINHQAKICGVKVYRLANAGNHLHLIICPSSRVAFNRFIRAVTGLIARAVLKAERGCSKAVRFWDKRPFSRILEWGNDYNTTVGYFMQNTLEALGFIPYQPRKKKSGLKVSTA
jgi:REP element-mobilizing transposase RayT